MSPDLNTIILGVTALVTALTPILLALINQKAKIAAQNTEIVKTTAIETKDAALATAASLEKVHVAVNSERSAMIDEVRSLREEIRQLSIDKATLQAESTKPSGMAP